MEGNLNLSLYDAKWDLNEITFHPKTLSATVSINIYVNESAMNAGIPLNTQRFTVDLTTNGELLNAISQSAQQAVLDFLGDGADVFVRQVAESVPPPLPLPGPAEAEASQPHVIEGG